MREVGCTGGCSTRWDCRIFYFDSVFIRRVKENVTPLNVATGLFEYLKSTRVETIVILLLFYRNENTPQFYFLLPFYFKFLKNRHSLFEHSSISKFNKFHGEGHHFNFIFYILQCFTIILPIYENILKIVNKIY